MFRSEWTAVLVVLALSAAVTAARALPVSAGFAVGARLTSFIEAPELYGSDFHRAWAARGTLEWPVGGRWSLATGLGYEEVGSAITVTVASGDMVIFHGRLHTALGYLGVPLCARWRPIRERRRFFVQAGPEIAYLERVMGQWHIDQIATTGGKTAIAARPMAQIVEDVSVPKARDPYFPWALFLDSSLGWEIPARGHRLVLQGRWVEGLTDMIRNEQFSRRARAIEVAAGWAW